MGSKRRKNKRNHYASCTLRSLANKSMRSQTSARKDRFFLTDHNQIIGHSLTIGVLAKADSKLEQAILSYHERSALKDRDGHDFCDNFQEEYETRLDQLFAFNLKFKNDLGKVEEKYIYISPAMVRSFISLEVLPTMNAGYKGELSKAIEFSKSQRTKIGPQCDLDSSINDETALSLDDIALLLDVAEDHPVELEPKTSEEFVEEIGVIKLHTFSNNKSERINHFRAVPHATRLHHKKLSYGLIVPLGREDDDSKVFETGLEEIVKYHCDQQKQDMDVYSVSRFVKELKSSGIEGLGIFSAYLNVFDGIGHRSREVVRERYLYLSPHIVTILHDENNLGFHLSDEVGKEMTAALLRTPDKSQKKVRSRKKKAIKQASSEVMGVVPDRRLEESITSKALSLSQESEGGNAKEPSPSLLKSFLSCFREAATKRENHDGCTFIITSDPQICEEILELAAWDPSSYQEVVLNGEAIPQRKSKVSKAFIEAINHIVQVRDVKSIPERRVVFTARNDIVESIHEGDVRLKCDFS